MSTQPVAKRRLDYQAPLFTISAIELAFELDPNSTKVLAVSHVSRTSTDSQASLVLDGENMSLQSVMIDGKSWSNYELDDSSLTLMDVPDEFELSIETSINPQENSSLEGLYLSAGAYCTQCEAEGFRKITYFLDRPDVLSEYTVTVIAPKKEFPSLLSNGNRIGKGELDDGRHWVKWHDPFKKPCYLFALVAGDFDVLEDSFTTKSGRDVQIELYVDKGKLSRGNHAVESLKKSMKWDEDVYGLEYDLDIYMIVAVDFFNMGAMENKGLNVFNSKFVLADPESATDDDYFNIESVIAHEYFHNWTGNRVTCRDWFQLSLKEGLTVFRDQQFSADMSSHVVNRIKNVRVIREHQFAEDASAMSHPIRPDEVIEMNNFYTVTVYDKGAEVIRMMHTLLGADGFRKGMDLYFERFDGQAVTCDDFVQAMADANNKDFSLFRNWYSQSGTPILDVSDSFDEQSKSYTLKIEQHTPATADQSEKCNLHIPVRIGLISRAGDIIPQLENEKDRVFNLTETSQMFTFDDIEHRPTPVLLGDFSAPVRLNYNYEPDQLLAIASHGTDDFSRWDATQKLYSQFIHQNAGADISSVEINAVKDMFNAALSVAAENPALSAEMLTIPSFETLAQQVGQYDVDALYNARKNLINLLSEEYLPALTKYTHPTTENGYAYEQHAVNARRLKNVALAFVGRTEQGRSIVEQQFHKSDNMTDTLGALRAAQTGHLPLFDTLMQAFESRWKEDALVLDKWFALHATTERTDTLARLELLSSHKQYTINNPNRVRALIGSFAFFNTKGFHAQDGSGYRYLTDYLLQLDKVNPQVASRLVTPLTQFRSLDDQRQVLVKHQLSRLLDDKQLSKDLFEKVSKCLSYQ